MSASKTEGTDPVQDIKDRFEYLQVTLHTLLNDFVVWNDVGRYPDLPADTPGSSRGRRERNRRNEFQIWNLYSSKEKAIILGLWVLLYDKGRDFATLRTLGNRLLDRKIFTLSDESRRQLEDTKEFFKGEEVYERFQANRNSFIAHVASINVTPNNMVEHSHIYRLVPKSICLAEVLARELTGLPTHYDTWFKYRGERVANYFSHSKPDELLAELFACRSLPADAFNTKVDEFLEKLHKRERAALKS